MIVIGIDPHESSHTATAVDPATNVDLGSLRIRSTEPDYRTLLEWSGRWSEHRSAVENAKGFGHHLSLWLVQQGESAVDVPSTAAVKMIASTPRPPRAWLHCKAMNDQCSASADAAY